MRLSIRSLLTLALTLAASIAPDLLAQPAAHPTYPAPAYSVTIPFAAPADFSNLTTTLKLLASVNNGQPHAFTVDTGSVGVVLPAIEIPGFNPKAPGNTPGQLRYASSGLTLTGFWTTATVRFHNPNTGQSVAEATVQVLAVTDGSCQGGGPNAGRCTGAIPHMLGVGFGRGGDAANGMRTQASNPFVNLTPMNQIQTKPGTPPAPSMRHGYLITQAGITFGLTDPQTRNFQFVKLTPANPGAPPVTALSSRVGSIRAPTDQQSLSSRPKAGGRSGETPVWPPAPAPTPAFARDYNMAPGFLTLGTQNYPMGTILMDTGLTNMIVEEPDAPTSGDLPAGQPVVVHLLGDQLRYRFTTGAVDTSVSPRRTTWATYSHGPFVNTGLRALACFDYLYDADNGYLGLRSTCTAN